MDMVFLRDLISMLLCCLISNAWSASLDQAGVRDLLWALKGEAAGPSNWSNSTVPCHWQGVNCPSGSEVTALSLSGLGLTGEIKQEFGQLPSLVTLNVSNNSISGSIPSSLGNLINLQTLDLSQNNLSGPIPHELGSLASLEKLYLDSNHLVDGIPSSFAKLLALTELSLSRNNLSGNITTGIEGLSKLERFVAYQNLLEGPLPSLQMSRLQYVNLASNSLTGPIPLNMCASGQLSVLNLNNNQLKDGIPKDLGLCNSLSTVRLGNNNLSGEIPQSFGQLPNLVYFLAEQNLLTGGLPVDIGGWKKLSLLNLANNRLNGSIPTVWTNASSLQELVLSYNEFSGPIPGDLVQCKNLSSLQLSGNRLNGSLPDNICSLPYLTTLQLDRNELSGDIPPSIGECSRLLELQLGDNQLNGSIPTQIGELQTLQVSLNLSLNKLTGRIPDSLGRLSRLVSLDLSYNQLSGPIPEALTEMLSLLDWNFSNNLLSGPIPTNGPLRNSSLSSFANNSGLCGDPLPPCEGTTAVSKGKGSPAWRTAGIVIACALVVLLIVSATVIAVMHKHYYKSAVDPVPPVSSISRFFSEAVEKAIDFESIKEATARNTNIISTNHFSTLYKAVMPSGLVLAAKRLTSAEKGLAIHQRKVILELDRMWKFSHENIMQPVGYYLESDLAIIIYEFVPSCSLSQRLHRNSESFLPWSTRYNVAIAAAEGLNFLHHACSPPRLHMDVSSNNIFLGLNLEVKLGDVEVAKLLDPSKHTGSISAVAGSVGYIAPEYAFTMRVTLASNVYSFGVVLLELLTGRRPVDESFGDGLDLVRWVQGASSRGEMPEQVLDARISAQSFASRQEMLSVLKVALLCTNPAPLKRPRMKKVLEALQEAKLSKAVLSPVSSS